MMDLISQMAFALAGVLLVILLLAFVYRKRQKASSVIGLISYQPIGQKMGVAALRVGNEVLVIGVTPTDFKLLKRLDERTAGLTAQPAGARNGGAAPEPAALPKDDIANLAKKVAHLRRIKENIHG